MNEAIKVMSLLSQVRRYLRSTLTTSYVETGKVLANAILAAIFSWSTRMTATY